MELSSVVSILAPTIAIVAAFAQIREIYAHKRRSTKVRITLGGQKVELNADASPAELQEQIKKLLEKM
jgi:hypothetical protein